VIAVFYRGREKRGEPGKEEEGNLALPRRKDVFFPFKL
jgi:hypothetical protein